ncbi:MAG: hypothetical protein JXB49_22040 [Bacteroidales bacterium]|nr:hypothetical protein [Bacteroidales bacterium]
MKLEGYKTDSYEFSGKASDLMRQFAFAGIAIIWIFRYDKPIDHLIPQECIASLVCFVVALGFDLLQYLIPTLIWTIFFRYHEIRNEGNTDVDVKASGWWSAPGWICFVAKTITLIIGYIKILSFLITKL